MFSDTLNRVIQGAGTHAPLRMTPVRPHMQTTSPDPPLDSHTVYKQSV